LHFQLSDHDSTEPEHGAWACCRHHQQRRATIAAEIFRGWGRRTAIEIVQVGRVNHHFYFVGFDVRGDESVRCLKKFDCLGMEHATVFLWISGEEHASADHRWWWWPVAQFRSQCADLDCLKFVIAHPEGCNIMLRVPIDEAGIPVGDIHVAYNKARRRMHVAASQESGNDMIRSHTEPGVPDFYEKAATIRPDCICVEGALVHMADGGRDDPSP